MGVGARGGSTLAAVAGDAAELLKVVWRVRSWRMQPEGLRGTRHPGVFDAEVAAGAPVYPVVQPRNPDLANMDSLGLGLFQLLRGPGRSEQASTVGILIATVLTEKILGGRDRQHAQANNAADGKPEPERPGKGGVVRH
jgi:hypothetical protein